ncbi:hypothetical protein BC332_21714 [Capsicum chinense]|nr:hypothetical protein BC332_21714 [Capsicum chinense]
MVTTPDALREGVTASDAAMTLGIAPAMAKEHLLAAEAKDFYAEMLVQMDSAFSSICCKKLMLMISSCDLQMQTLLVDTHDVGRNLLGM